MHSTSPRCKDNLAKDWWTVHRPRGCVIIIVLVVEIKVTATSSIAIWTTGFILVIQRIISLDATILVPQLEGLAQTAAVAEKL